MMVTGQQFVDYASYQTQHCAHQPGSESLLPADLSSQTSCSTSNGSLTVMFGEFPSPNSFTASGPQTSVLHRGHLFCLNNHRSIQAWWKECPQAGRRRPASSSATMDKQIEHSSSSSWEPVYE